MPFVQMHTALQAHHLGWAELTEYQTPPVALHGNRGHVRDLAVGHDHAMLQVIGEVAQARAQHHPDLRHANTPPLQRFGCLVKLLPCAALHRIHVACLYLARVHFAPPLPRIRAQNQHSAASNRPFPLWPYYRTGSEGDTTPLPQTRKHLFSPEVMTYMSSKFSDFLKSSKIDARRVIAISKKLEHLRPEDRAIKLKKRNSKGSDAAKPAEGEAAAKPSKPRSGRPITTRAMASAQAGKVLSGPQKTRMLRAVNALLEQKKKPAVDLKALF